MGWGFAPTRELWRTNALCGFSCGRSAHSGSDHHQQPPCLAGSPSPGDHTASLGTHILGCGQRASSWGLGWGTHGGQREKSERRKEKKKVDVKRKGKEEKVEGRLVGVTYHIVYHIQKFQVCLSSRRLR